METTTKMIPTDTEIGWLVYADWLDENNGSSREVREFYEFNQCYYEYKYVDKIVGGGITGSVGIGVVGICNTVGCGNGNTVGCRDL